MAFPPRLTFGLGAVLVAVAIALSAWHAHGLVERLDAHAYQSFARGVQQQILAGLGLMLVGLLLHIGGTRLTRVAAAGIFLGAVLFCGDVYFGALRGEGLGVAPFGGSLSILSWLLLGVSQLLRPPSRAVEGAE